jgi:hypothetical protein
LHSVSVFGELMKSHAAPLKSIEQLEKSAATHDPAGMTGMATLQEPRLGPGGGSGQVVGTGGAAPIAVTA